MLINFIIQFLLVDVNLGQHQQDIGVLLKMEFTAQRRLVGF